MIALSPTRQKKLFEPCSPDIILLRYPIRKINMLGLDYNDLLNSARIIGENGDIRLKWQNGLNIS
jgi:hypothetical protein